MSDIETGGRVYPMPETDRNPESPGINLRDYLATSMGDEEDEFAVVVKESLLGRKRPVDWRAILEFEAEFRAVWRYMRADAMLAARKGRQA